MRFPACHVLYDGKKADLSPLFRSRQSRPRTSHGGREQFEPPKVELVNVTFEQKLNLYVFKTGGGSGYQQQIFGADQVMNHN